MPASYQTDVFSDDDASEVKTSLSRVFSLHFAHSFSVGGIDTKGKDASEGSVKTREGIAMYSQRIHLT